MALTFDEVRRSNLFTKSSTDDYQDPVFLTFRIDFFHPEEEYPKYSGLSNSNLLKPQNLPTDPTNQNQIVEYSAISWLNQYYGDQAYAASGVSPAGSLEHFIKQLKYIQDSPWYFQSIQGIGDLWKGMHKVKEGNQQTVLTVNCIDSIRQPLTDMAEHYRYAVYDQERLAYRLPENLRWFDMVIYLVEIRDIADPSGQFYKSDSSGQLTSGLKVLQFRCKMCEFDFSGFMGGSQSDHKIYTEEKQFSPTFNINVGWVIQEQVALSDANDYRKIGLFSGALDTLNNRLSRFIQTAVRLPGTIVGSVLNEIQTTVETKVMGNIYSGFNDTLSNLSELTEGITGRAPLVGPPLISNVGTDIYPDTQKSSVSEIDDIYPTQPQPNRVDDMGDSYPGRQATLNVDDMGDVYP